jgi:hypothetical protein
MKFTIRYKFRNLPELYSYKVPRKYRENMLKSLQSKNIFGCVLFVPGQTEVHGKQVAISYH